MPSNNSIHKLTISALVLTGLAMLCGLVIIDAIVHPDRYERQPTEQMAEAEDTQTKQPVIEVVDGKDVVSGFVAEGEYELVVATCTACHSGKLVLQNRATADGWRDMIHWMQQTQNLWDLGENEDKIVEYLATHYAPEESGRRPNLAVEDEEWYWID